MNLNKLNEFRFGNFRQVETKPGTTGRQSFRESAIRESAVERSRSINMGTNLLSIIQRYTVAGSFLRELTDIIRKVNAKNEPA